MKLNQITYQCNFTCYNNLFFYSFNSINFNWKGFGVFDFNIIKDIYEKIPTRVSYARNVLGRPLTLSEKILYSHLYITETHGI